MNEAGAVAFRADRAEGVSGIFVGDSAGVTTVADTEGDWSGFHGLPVINTAGTVVFRADRRDGVQGIYAGREGSVRVIVETTEDMFETLALFPSVDDGGAVAFAATLRAGGAGIFTVDEGRVIPLIDTESGFEAFRGALISSAGAVAFIATPRGESPGLFAGPDPEADRILALGDQLLGSTVEDLAANPVSVNAAGQLAVRASLTDGRQLIVRASRR
jgi:hypothetical protein